MATAEREFVDRAVEHRCDCGVDTLGLTVVAVGLSVAAANDEIAVSGWHAVGSTAVQFDLSHAFASASLSAEICHRAAKHFIVVLMQTPCAKETGVKFAIGHAQSLFGLSDRLTCLAVSLGED